MSHLPQNLCVSVIVPFENDEAVLHETLVELQTLLARRYEHYEILLVDNGSCDNSRADAERALEKFDHLRLICLSDRHPLENAIQAGLDAAIGDVIAVLIAGFDPVPRLPDLIDRVLKTRTILVGRLSPQGLSFSERLSRRAFYKLVNGFFKLGFPEFSSPFMAMTRQSLNSLTSLNRKLVYLTAFNRRRGTPIDYFDYEPIDFARRHFRKLGEQINLAIDVIVSNSSRPLRLASVTALGMSTVNFTYVAYLLVAGWFRPGPVEPWIEVKMQSAANFFVLSALLAVGGEYLWKALQGVQERRHYFIIKEARSTGSHRVPSKRNVVDDSRFPASRPDLSA